MCWFIHEKQRSLRARVLIFRLFTFLWLGAKERVMQTRKLIICGECVAYLFLIIFGFERIWLHQAEHGNQVENERQSEYLLLFVSVAKISDKALHCPFTCYQNRQNSVKIKDLRY